MDRRHSVLGCRDGHVHNSSMVIGDLDIEGVATLELEAQPPPPVDADAPLTGSIALQGFEAVGRRRAQILDAFGEVQLMQAHQGSNPDTLRQPAGLPCRKQPLGFLVGAIPYHPVAPVVMTFGNPTINHLFLLRNTAESPHSTPTNE